MSKMTDVVKMGLLKNNCKSCGAARYCLSASLKDEDLTTFDNFVKHRKPLRRSERLFRAGDSFRSIYVVKAGSAKTYVESSDGEYQITGFHFAGELLGIDGIESGHHTYTVEALETSSFCEIPYNRLLNFGKDRLLLQKQLFCHMSREINREQELMLVLGKMDSRRRLACFLVRISLFMYGQGCSPTNINLSMTRYDIANYLGLAVETVSRLLTIFQNDGTLEVFRRNIVVKKQERLLAIAENRPEQKCRVEEENKIAKLA